MSCLHHLIWHFIVVYILPFAILGDQKHIHCRKFKVLYPYIPGFRYHLSSLNSTERKMVFAMYVCSVKCKGFEIYPYTDPGVRTTGCFSEKRLHEGKPREEIGEGQK